MSSYPYSKAQQGSCINIASDHWRGGGAWNRLAMGGHLAIGYSIISVQCVSMLLLSSTTESLIGPACWVRFSRRLIAAVAATVDALYYCISYSYFSSYSKSQHQQLSYISFII